MARKQSSTLVHCASCGEDYSATYKFCPFCGGRNTPSTPASAPSQPPVEDKQEGYQFDGQDVFDQPDGSNASSKGGKRLASGGAQRPTPPPPINWPRLITFLCSLVIIAAALVMCFKVFYPHLREVSNPEDSIPPVVTPSASVSTDGLVGMSLDTVDLTLQAQQSHALVLTFDPVDWEGTVAWSTSDATCATVNEEGVVTNVNTSGTARRAVITATTGEHTVTCTVYCQSATVTTPPPSTAPSETPTQPVQSGSISNGSKGVIINASGGLRVRSGPGTSYDVQASLNNGDPITVVSYAGDDWYEITYGGSNGSETGYIMGEYISVN